MYRSEDTAVRYGVPWEAQPQYVDEDTEENHGEVAYHLVDGSSEYVRLYLLPCLSCRLYACKQIYQHGEDHEHEADEHYHHSMPDVLCYV